MAMSIKERLAAAIEAADRETSELLAATRERSAEAEAAFRPVWAAANELREELLAVNGIELTINPDSVCITLVDRELWFSYDPEAHEFFGEESAHSWYDGERYGTRFTWSDAEACIESMIRSCAQYCRMARAINAASTPR
jgi:hypothetical protein